MLAVGYWWVILFESNLHFPYTILLYVILAFEYSILMILEITLISPTKKITRSNSHVDKPSVAQSGLENTHSSMQILHRAVTIRATLASWSNQHGADRLSAKRWCVYVICVSQISWNW